MSARLRYLGALGFLVLALEALTAGRAFAGAFLSPSMLDSSAAVAVAYGTPEAYKVSLEYAAPPHLSRVTYYRRPVYVYGLFDHWETLYALTQSEDACEESLGPLRAQEARVVQEGGTLWLEIRYSQDVLHSNPRFGSFQAGSRTIIEREPVEDDAGTRDRQAASAPPAQGLDVALRTLSSVQEFADYAAVRESSYAQDIEDAFRLGLIQGKYDYENRFYDPEGLITAGEMLNILARNLGAPSSTDGMASATYLSSIGISGPDDHQSYLTLAQMESLASQIARLDQAGKGDLLVIREALEGTLEADRDGGITRAHAVAMFHPGLALVVPPSETHLPDPVPSWPSEGSSGGHRIDGGSEDPVDGTGGSHLAGPEQGQDQPASSGLPLFILTD